MPICARCTAIYLGLFAGLVLFCLVPSMRETWTRGALLAAAAVMAIDGGTQALGLRESTNDLRLATGLAFGAALGVWALSAIEARRRAKGRPAGGPSS